MKYYKKKPKAYKKKSYAKKVRRVSSIKNIVKKTINRMTETKSQSYTSGNTMLPLHSAIDATFLNQTINLAPMSTTLIIQQGTGEDERIGNNITTVKAQLKIAIFPVSYNATYNPNPKPQIIQLFLWKPRKNMSLGSAQAIADDTTGEFFQVGSSSEGFQSRYLDYQRPVNKDRLILFKKFVFKVGFQTGMGAAASPIGQYMANNDFKMNILKTINITKYLPKKVMFNDADNDSHSDPLYMTICPFTADGSAPVANEYQNQYAYAIDYFFKDA